MALTILSQHTVMQIVFLYHNVRLGWPWVMPYSLEELHVPGWNRIDYAPSMAIPLVSMYINYIAALEVVSFFLHLDVTRRATTCIADLSQPLALISHGLNEKWRASDRRTSSVRSLWTLLQERPLLRSVYALPV